MKGKRYQKRYVCYPLFTGTFSLLVLTKDSFVAVRDHRGIRPLSLGKLNGGYVIASGTCAFKTIGAEFYEMCYLEKW